MTGQPLAAPGFPNRFIGCRAELTGTLTVADTTFTTVDLTAADIFDTDQFHDPAGANPSRMTIPSGLGGVYEIVGHAGFAANAVGSRMIRLLKNGATLWDELIASAGSTSTSAAEACRFQCLCPGELLVPGDFIQMQVRQTSGIAINLDQGRLVITHKGGFA